MTEQRQTTTIGQLPAPEGERSRVPALTTRVVWLLWGLSLVALTVWIRRESAWELGGLLVVDGLTVVMWAAVTFFSGIVHSYSRRYMAGTPTIARFFGRAFAFTLSVLVLVAADGFLLFGAAWLAMGLLMADLIGHVEGWPQARAAGALARRYFLASSALLVAALGTLWWAAGTTTVSGVASAVGVVPSATLLLVAGALLLAAMVQSALLPFHGWLFSSMTAPTPASALMHAGFVNAGGVLLVRFAPVVTAVDGFVIVASLLGATSALGGKFLKTVQTDVKGQLGCSTVGQMGFMIMQAGLGFSAAAMTHLVLHGFYKAYQFLGAGSQITHEHPGEAENASTGPVGVAVIGLTGLAGGVLFATLTGKGTALDGGLLLALLVVVTVLHAAREVVSRSSLPPAVRYGAVPLVALPAIAVYAAVYGAIEGLLVALPAVGGHPELTAVHGLVAAAFVGAYVALETGVYRYSPRLYVALVNAASPASETLLTSTETYNEH